jgi:hypothetical protein
VLFQAWTGQDDGRVAVHRFLDQATNTHFFTAGDDEKNYVLQNFSHFVYEGTAFFAYSGESEGMQAVYRFFDMESGGHLYTVDENERLAWTSRESLTNEGAVFYVQ